jgi:hypothetical protein
MEYREYSIGVKKVSLLENPKNEKIPMSQGKTVSSKALKDGVVALSINNELKWPTEGKRGEVVSP